jgi:exodeoxyribonuclease VIII
MISVNSPPSTPVWNETQTNEEYHGCKTAVGSTLLKTILKSPASFLHRYQNPTKSMPHLEFGSAMHTLLDSQDKFLEEYIASPNFGDMRNAANKAMRAEWITRIKPHAKILSEDDYIKLFGMYQSVLKHPQARGLIKKPGRGEHSLFYSDPITGISCKVRPDRFLETDNILVDFKTTTDITEDGFSRSMWQYRYDFQAAMYAEALSLITGVRPKVCAIIAIEKEPPFEVAVYRLNDETLYKGALDYRRALDTLAACLKTNEWRTYQPSWKEIGLPAWALSKEL